MPLTEKEQQRIWASSKDVSHSLQIVRFDLAQVIGDLLGETSCMPSTCDSLLPWAARQTERNKLANLRKVLRHIGPCLHDSRLCNADGNCYIST